MSLNPKDSAEVMEFMTLFARLKQWCDDAPDELADFAKTDSSVRELGFSLSLTASFLKMNEKRHRALFASPVDPAFLVAWRDYEARYEAVLADTWLADFMPELGSGEPSQVLKADLQWDVANDEAMEQSSGIEEAIEFAHLNANQDWRDFPEGSVERVQDGVAAWERLQRDTGFDLHGVFRRRELIPFVLVPRQVPVSRVGVPLSSKNWPTIFTVSPAESSAASDRRMFSSTVSTTKRPSPKFAKRSGMARMTRMAWAGSVPPRRSSASAARFGSLNSVSVARSKTVNLRWPLTGEPDR
jgi:hypothetical protein